MRTLSVLALAALGVTIAGDLLGTHVAPTKGHIGSILRRVGAGIYAGLYILLVLVHLGAWTYRWHLKSYRRRVSLYQNPVNHPITHSRGPQLMWGISFALIPLGVRAAYAILAAWSSADLFGAQPSSNPTLTKFNPITGDWVLYLVLSLLMEYLVVVIYLFSSIILSRRRR